MKYVALLRGINVGGNSKVDMKQLKAAFESVGMAKVKTYINSGNVLFEDAHQSLKKLTSLLENVIVETFGFEVKVLLRTQAQIEAICTALPSDWKNDADQKTDVMFLWEEADDPAIVSRLNAKKEFDEVLYLSGAVLWHVDRKFLTKSSMLKLVGTPLYKQMTIRNCNTVRKLRTLMAEL
jgi:uncharacterized protein (DUF1697 family)